MWLYILKRYETGIYIYENGEDRSILLQELFKIKAARA